MTKEIAVRGGGELAKYSPDKYNVLTPVVASQDIPQGARMSVRVVTIDPTPKSGDTYRVADKVCLTKVAIERMAAAAGVSVLEVTRTDDRTIPHVYGFRARIRVVDPDGLSREASGTKELDYRDGAKDASGSTDRALQQKRKYAAEECASKALLRAMRSCLAIRSGYKADELAKPFAIAKLILDSEDADAKRTLLSNMSSAQAQLYGPADRGSAGPDITVDAGLGSNVDVKDPDVGPDNKPPVDEPTDDDREAVEKMLRDVWEYAKRGGVNATEFKRIANESGKAREELTKDDVQAIIDKVNVRVTELAEADDGDEVPY